MNLNKIASLAIVGLLLGTNSIAGEINYNVSERTDVTIDENLKLVCVRLYPNAKSSSAVSGCWTFSQVMKDTTLDDIVIQAKKQLKKGETK